MAPQAPATNEIDFGKSFDELTSEEYEALPQYVKNIDIVATLLQGIGIHGDPATQREIALFVINTAMRALADIKVVIEDE